MHFLARRGLGVDGCRSAPDAPACTVRRMYREHALSGSGSLRFVALLRTPRVCNLQRHWSELPGLLHIGLASEAAGRAVAWRQVLHL